MATISFHSHAWILEKWSIASNKISSCSQTDRPPVPTTTLFSSKHKPTIGIQQGDIQIKTQVNGGQIAHSPFSMSSFTITKSCIDKIKRQSFCARTQKSIFCGFETSCMSTQKEPARSLSFWESWERVLRRNQYKSTYADKCPPNFLR